METDENGGFIPNKNVSQKDWQYKLSSKIKEIESIIKNNDLEEKQKILEIQKNNAYIKLEKIGKELQDIENFLEEENDNKEIEDVEDEESLKKKIYDIKQKNLSIQGQLNIIKEYSEFIKKYKINQIKEKKKIKTEYDNIKKDMNNNILSSKMNEEEKIILSKKEELEKVNKEYENLLKKIEEQKAQKYIKNIRLKQLKKLSNQNITKKLVTNKKSNKNQQKKSIIKNNNKNSEVDEIINDIIQNQESISKSKETKIESTFDIINRRIPFSISSIDNLINDKNENSNIFKTEKIIINKNYSNKKDSTKKNISDIIRLEKEKISRIISSSENKNKANLNNNKKEIVINNKNNIINDKNDNKKNNNTSNMYIKENKNIFNEDNPLAWLDNDNANNNFDNKNDIINNNYNVNIKEENNKNEIKKESEKETHINENNNNSNISEVRGLIGRRRPFAQIKF